MHRIISGILINLSLILIVSEVQALPEFGVKYNQSCQLCHVNPTGGGMRALYGAQFFSYMELPMHELEDFAGLDSINPTIGKHFQFGVDFRSLYYSSDDTLSGNSFITMEGTLYTSIAPTDMTMVYLSRSLHGSSEAFALLQGLPVSGALRVGRFMPAYGWRFVDHNSYSRNRLGFGQGQGEEDGIEFGLYPMEWEASVAVTNGSAGIVDGNRGKTVIARSLKRYTIGAVSLTGGMSWRYAEFNAGKGLSSFGIKRCGGPFWGVNYGPLTYLGESDWIVTNSTALVVTHVAQIQLRRGIYLNGQYDFYDPDLDVKSGNDWRGRIGFDVFPTGYLEFLPGFVWERLRGVEHGTVELQLHVWF